MKTDEILQKDVSNALKWESPISISNIIVISNDGVVTLTGVVENYSKKTQAENSTRKIAGVKSVINKIHVIINSWEGKKDVAIKAEILTIFRWNWNTLNDTIKVSVINGWVTLFGELEWNYQKEAAKEAVVNLIGVKGVSNYIGIKSQSDTVINSTALRLALENHHALDSKNIEIEVLDSKIILTGTVDSWYQKEIVGRIAWKTPGVIHVINELLIEKE